MSTLILISVAVNLIAFVQMFVDKQLALKGRRRISETQLIAPVLLSGIIGVVVGMLIFRHKTAKVSFQLKLLLALVLFIAAVTSYTSIAR